MSVVALTFHDGHGGKAYGHEKIDGDKMTLGVFAAESDVGNVAAGQATVLRDIPVGDPAGSQGDTVSHGWAT